MSLQPRHNAVSWRQDVKRLLRFVFADLPFDIEDVLLNLVDGLLCLGVEVVKLGLRLSDCAL